MNKILLFLIMVLAAATVSAQSTFSVKIIAGADDAEQEGIGVVTDNADDDIDIGGEGGTVLFGGFIFRNVTINQGEEIQDAYIQFTAHDGRTGAIDIIIKCEDNVDPPAFANVVDNISARNTTASQVIWNITAAWANAERSVNTRTVNLKTIVQEVIDNPSWMPGKSISFIFLADGGINKTIEVESFEGIGPNDVGELTIVYGPAGLNDPEEMQEWASVFPNPVTQTSIISVNSVDYGIMDLTVFDLLGRNILENNNISLRPGLNEIPFRFTDMNPEKGMYLLQLRKEGKSNTIRIFVK